MGGGGNFGCMGFVQWGMKEIDFNRLIATIEIITCLLSYIENTERKVYVS